MEHRLDYLSVTEISFIVVDFEAVTHKGHSPEPIEIGAMRIQPPGVVDLAFKVDELICPPDNLPLTPFFTAATGIAWADVQNKASAQEVLSKFDRLFIEHPYILVAQNAHFEAAIFSRFADACPHIVQIPFIDTLALAKFLFPKLRSYRLDTLAAHFSLPIPVNRHRALADVELTCRIFLRLLDLWKSQHRDWSIHHLKRVAGISVNLPPDQPTLFG
jgi:DNA polymerase-3 subunit epsilon